MPRRSRRYKESRRQVESGHVYPLEEAIGKVKAMPPARFDETMECSVKLGIDPRHSDQQVRGNLNLPHGTGKSVIVAVFAEGDRAEAAREAGADIIGADDLVERIQGGFTGFDVAIATPDMMGRIGRLGRILGPRGLMPSPKSGTVVQDIGEAIRQFKAGRIEFRNDSGGNVHLPVGKVSFSVEALAENVRTVIDQLVRMKPVATKGRYVQKIYIGSTMSPAFQIELGQPASGAR